MDNIQEAFINYVTNFDKDNIEEDSIYRLENFEAGYKAANLLPTEKDCPECLGLGTLRTGDNEEPDKIICPVCKGLCIVQQYYTPEDYLRITGEDYPDDCLVHVCYGSGNVHTMKLIDFYHIPKIEWVHKKWCVIVQTAQPAPEVDYKLEVI